MRFSIPSLVVVVLAILVSLGLVIDAICTKDQEDFVQCLLDQASPSTPINEAIYTPNNSTFGSVLQSYIRNLRFNTTSTLKPLVIVTPKHESHVQSTVTCAKKVGLQIRIRSGGHDYDGLSYVSQVPFVLLDMSNLRDIEIDVANEKAYVQAGATLGELYYRIANSSNVHAFPAGVCFTLGIGGHFSGGGYGNLMRKYGLSIDNIIDAELIDVNGRVLNRTSMGEDLFWAIRGGGAASFGVVLSFTIKLVRVPETVTVFWVEKTLEENGTELFYKWQDISSTIDDELFIRLELGVVNGTKEGQKTIKGAFIGMFLGSIDRLVSVVNSTFRELGLREKDCKAVTWAESLLFWDNTPPGTSVDAALLSRKPGAIYLKRKSDYVQEPLSKTGLESIWKAMIDLGDVGMAWNPYGGRMSEIDESATPFPHRRGNLFKIQYSTNWFQGGIETTNDYLNRTRSLYKAMTTYVSKNPRESFLNYRDIDIGSIGSDGNGTYEEASVYGQKYFKGNFERLVKVKTQVDPENFFRYEQSIPTSDTYRISSSWKL